MSGTSLDGIDVAMIETDGRDRVIPGPALTISPNGTNAAKSATATFTAAGAYTFQVTVTDQGGLTATSSVTVTVTQTAASVTVAPPTANVHENATQGFAATLRDRVT